MTLNEYQKQAMTTCMDSCKNFSYMGFNLVGEVGEFMSKIAKAIRKGRAGVGLYNERNKFIFSAECPWEETLEREKDLMKEAGDILWQLAGLCQVMGWDLETIAQMNIEKLASRQKRNVIDGDGDNR